MHDYERKALKHVFLDNGAAGSLIREDFAALMGIPGTNEMVDFGTFHRQNPLLPSRTVDFEVFMPHDYFVMFAVTADSTPVLKI